MNAVTGAWVRDSRLPIPSHALLRPDFDAVRGAWRVWGRAGVRGSGVGYIDPRFDRYIPGCGDVRFVNHGDTPNVVPNTSVEIMFWMTLLKPPKNAI